MSSLALVSETPLALPALIAGAGKPAAQRFLEFFTVHIRNPNTRAAYGRSRPLALARIGLAALAR